MAPVLNHLDLPSTWLCMHNTHPGGCFFTLTTLCSGSEGFRSSTHVFTPSPFRSLVGGKSHLQESRDVLTCHVQQASLWPWQQHQPRKPTTSEQRKRSSSQPQQHIFSHHLQPIISRPSHLATCTRLAFTHSKHGPERVCPPVKPESRPQDTTLLP